MDVSVIIVNYNTKLITLNCIDSVCLRTTGIDYEIILVNDASPDNSWQAILQECSIDHRIKGINLSRNFGQHRAILSGLQYAKGDWVIVMDCDHQDKPEEISTLYKKDMMLFSHKEWNERTTY